MDFELGKIYHGFELTQQKFIKEEDFLLRMFEHKKTGAKLLNLQNDDENKVFSISFKTYPEDNTGMTHVLEHCVLNGSRKYPIKDPFAELEKGSFYTYLNAVTYGEMTAFPIATTNEKELFNMIDIYMDAVFYPNIYQNHNIFNQEGWRYEIDEEGKLIYNGIVYNEMKAKSVSKETAKVLFKDTPYQFCSGGNLEDIPNLTCEKLLEFHEKYYHPSNSYIYLYGNADIEKQLKFLNEEYLQHFDKKDINIEINMPEFVKRIEPIEYEYQADESIDKDSRNVTFDWLIDGKINKEFTQVIDILLRLLIVKEKKTLNKNIVDQKICKDLSTNFSIIDNSKTVISIMGEYCSVKDIDKFRSVLFETLNTIFIEGFDEKEIIEIIKQKRFAVKRPKADKGIGLSYNAICHWINKGDLIDLFEYEEVLEKIKQNYKNDYFKEKLKQWILDNEKYVIVVGKPNSKLLEQREKRINKKLSEIQKSLTTEQIDKIIKENEQLKKYQDTPDQKEMLNKIPKISLNNISRIEEEYNLIEENYNDCKILFYPTNIKNIVDIDFFINFKCIEQELLPYVALIRNLLNNKLSTKNYSHEKITDLIYENSRSISFGLRGYLDHSKKESSYNSKFMIRLVALKEELEESFKILKEIITNTVFEKDIERIKRLVTKNKINFKDDVYSDPVNLATDYLLANYSELHKYYNLGRNSYYKMLCKIEKELEENPEKTIERFNIVKQKIFNRQNLIINIVTDKDTYKYVKQNLNIVLDSLDNTKYEEQNYKFEPSIKRLGIIIPSNVNYVMQGYSFKKLGYKDSGKIDVMKKIANEYLYNEVRVKNGAYGCTMTNGCVNCKITSKRDSNITKTLDTYKNIGNYLKNVNITEKELEAYKLSILRNIDSPETIFDKNSNAVSDYLLGLKFADNQRVREEIFDTNCEDIRNLATMIDDIVNQDCYCVIGNETQIKQHADIFDKIIEDITEE